MKHGCIRRIFTNPGETVGQAVDRMLANCPEGTVVMGSMMDIKLNGPAFPEIQEGESYKYALNENFSDITWENLQYVDYEVING